MKDKEGKIIDEKREKKRSRSVLIDAAEKVGEVERYFFKYAFPCAQVKARLGSLNQEEYEKLKEIFLENKCPDRETLEKLFPPAFRRLRKLAEKMNKDVWDFSVISEYWKKNHNEIIDGGEGMYGTANDEFKDLCKIHTAVITEKKGSNLIVNYGGRERAVSGFLVQDVKIGERVRIHFAYAIEKVV